MDLDAWRERSRETWESMAVGWEAREAFLAHNMGVLDDWIVEQVTPSSGDVVLDVGAGPGGLGHRIAALVAPEGRVLSTDFAAEMVEVARRLGTARALDAESMGLDDDVVDAVV
ncbi:MAG: methyltransferase domain-containing protein, partial [Ilumatobacteraceae bacterium]